MNWRGAAAVTTGFGLLAAAALWPAEEPIPLERLASPRAPQREAPEASAPEAGPGTLSPAPPRPSATLAPLPRSLRGTDVDGALVVDESGRFVPNPDALAFFDYFLAASGEEPPDVIEARIRAAIRGRLAPEAAASAEQLLGRLLAMREELRELTREGDVPHDLERRLQWLRELRREYFGEETARALFGEQEQVVAVDLERRRVATDPALSEAERAEALDALEQALPERVAQARERARAPATLRAEVAALRAAGASESEVFATRASHFGDDAAHRLAALDAERADWQARLEAYRLERATVVEDAAADGRSASETELALATLRSQHFSAAEVPRVRQLDRADRVP